MKFEISNLGYIKQAEIELGDLTIICGKNNTGKTYVNYAIYGFLKNWKYNLDFEIENEVNQLLEEGKGQLSLSEYKNKFIDAVAKFSKFYSKLLPQIFNVNNKLLQQVNFAAKIDNFSIDYSNNTITNSSLNRINEEDDLLLMISNFKRNSILEFAIYPDIFKVGNSEKPNLEKAKKHTNKSTIEKLIKQGLSSIITESYFPNPFIITSERTGVSLFYKELDKNKNLMIEMMQKQIINNISFDLSEIFNQRISRYPQPVQDEINFVRDLYTIGEHTGELAETNPEIIDLLIDIIGGDYSVTDYSMSFKFTEDNKLQEIPLYSASSTVKSLINLYFYLKHLAKPGDILIIDEPELNLHPENQRKLAKIFSRLTKCGLKLLMTTHSDYLIKELNNLIILKNDFEKKSELMEEYKYSEEDILEPDKVRVYVAENNTLNPAKITPLGIEVPTFDDEIINMTDFYDEAYYEVIDNIDI
ncbi:MAG: AAA family ATPase [Crocosphaera sp.]